jgi:adenylosuccinate lyase
MEKREIYENLSPLDHRYYSSNRDLFNKISEYLSEKASVKYLVKVESAILKGHIKREKGGIPYSLEEQIDNLINTVTPDEVYQEEEKTKHNIRALVNVIKKKSPRDISRFVHLGATSVDILDTAFNLRIKDVIHNVILPVLIDVEELLISITENEAATAQVGRTHGQYAIPITFGFAMAEYVSRLGKSIEEILKKSRELRGKLSGAVGAYNAMGLIDDDPEQFEREVLQSLKLKPSEYSNQLVEPEYLLRLLLELNTCFGVFANLADDLRNLQRSEIAELQELFSNKQVGSSTMPQKRNPWNSEHVKSLWKTFCPRVITFYMDQISEHQRDLTNSASSRFITEYITGFASAAARLKKILSTLKVDRLQMKKNISLAGDLLLAESAYILLALGGESEGHEVIRTITLKCEEKKTSLLEELKNFSSAYSLIKNELKKREIDIDVFFSDPEHYIGKAKLKSERIANSYKNKMQQIKEEL